MFAGLYLNMKAYYKIQQNNCSKIPILHNVSVLFVNVGLKARSAFLWAHVCGSVTAVM